MQLAALQNKSIVDCQNFFQTSNRVLAGEVQNSLDQGGCSCD